MLGNTNEKKVIWKLTLASCSGLAYFQNDPTDTMKNLCGTKGFSRMGGIEAPDTTHQMANPHSHRPIMEDSNFKMNTAWAVIPGIMKSSGRMSAASPPSWTDGGKEMI